MKTEKDFAFAVLELTIAGIFVGVGVIGENEVMSIIDFVLAGLYLGLSINYFIQFADRLRKQK